MTGIIILNIWIFFQANGIEDDNKRKAILLSSCGSDTYKLFKKLAAPTVLTSTSYEDIKYLINKHKDLKPNSIVKYFKFNNRNHADSETISKYMAEL